MSAPALVGRDRELAALDDLIARAAMRERAVAVITGEPGIGKSRLLHELARRSTFAGGRAVWGRCDEVGLTPAFWPWMQQLRALETTDDRAPNPTSLDQRADASTRLARFEEVVGFVCRRAEAQLVVLMFDDMHAADLSSLQLLEYALPRFADARVAVAFAARDRDASTQVATALGRLQRGAQRLSLARLAREDVAALVGDRVSRDASARVWELSEGNPLFIEELVASVADGAVGLPQVSTVRAVIRDRVDRLAPPTIDALVAAAVVGRDFRGAIVADMLGITDDDVAARLAPVVRLGIVAPVSADRNRFSHVLVAEVLADELDPNTRARLHLRAAEALERRDADDRSAIAHHLLAAGHLAADAAVTAAERAAARAMAQLAFEDAAALLERAMQVLPLAAPTDRARRVRLLCAWAESLQHAGEHARANTLCDEAATIARELSDGELLARTALVRGIEMRFGFPNPTLVEALHEAERLLVPGSPLRPKLLARLAAAEQPAPDPAGPVARARDAIALASSLADRDRLDVLYIATAALVDYLPATEIAAIHEQTLALARAAGERVIAIHTRVRLAFALLERGDRRGFDELVGVLHAEAQAIGLPRWIRTTHLLSAAAALLDGRFEDAERAADAAEEAAAGEAQATFLVAAHRLFAASVRGTTPAHQLRHVMLSYTPARSMFAAWLAAQDRDADATRSALGQVALATLDREMLAMLVPAIVFVGTREQAMTAFERLRTYERPMIVASMLGSTVLELLGRARLLLAARLGQWDEIDAFAEHALEQAARLGSPVWAAKVRADWAEALDARARAGDRERAIELRDLARADAGRVGLTALLDRLTVKPAVKAVKDEPVTIAKEGELWLVRGFGEVAHIKDSRGMQMLARLVGEPLRELHVLDLAGANEPVDGGDSGELLDPKARAAYKARLAELIAERDRAEAWSDVGRAERASAEIEALTSELERAIGSGGRARRGASASERARSNVQRRVQHAIAQVRAASTRLGEHLAATVHTGTYCSYSPRT